MTAKEYLKRYAAEKKEADTIEERIRELREKREHVQAVRFSGTPRTKQTKDLSGAEAAIDRLVRTYEEKILSYVGKEARIIETIDRMTESEERKVLMLKYVLDINPATGKKWTWYEIAEEIPCSKRTAQYIHGRALLHFPIDP